jgi:hypothetical protein
MLVLTVKTLGCNMMLAEVKSMKFSENRSLRGCLIWVPLACFFWFPMAAGAGQGNIIALTRRHDRKAVGNIWRAALSPVESIKPEVPLQNCGDDGHGGGRGVDPTGNKSGPRPE